MSQSSPLARFETAEPLRAQVASWRAMAQRVVLVPTMGALHEGHLSLMAHARTLGERVIASIFVNPTQFGPTEDFSRYPRDLEADLALLASAGVDAAYTPSMEEMYPAGFSTSVTVSGVTEGLCGAFRPGHFSGVATVVTKLIGQTCADVALFGEKDFQQLLVIRRAARDLDLGVEIAGAPILRESDGLALSSRNRYLSEPERAVAPWLNQALSRIAEATRDGSPVEPHIAKAIADLTAAGFSPVQYVAVCDAKTLAPVERVTGPARVLAAAYLGATRLIDNVAIT